MILGAKYPLVNDFVLFLQARKITNIVFLDTNNNLAEQQVRPVKVINKDQWQNFYDFVTTISPDLDDYDEMSACKYSTGGGKVHVWPTQSGMLTIRIIK